VFLHQPFRTDSTHDHRSQTSKPCFVMTLDDPYAWTALLCKLGVHPACPMQLGKDAVLYRVGRGGMHAFGIGNSTSHATVR
jgi:hypothetical protein